MLKAPINQESKQEPKNLIIFIILGVVLGLLAGFVGAFLLIQNYSFVSSILLQNDNGTAFNSSQAKLSVVEEESGTINVVKNAAPSVVSIIISKELKQGTSSPNVFNDFFSFPFDNQFNQPFLPQDNGKTEKTEIGGGTGFIVSSDGLILTNKHVVNDDQAEYTVVSNDGQKYAAKVLGKDPLNDLAVIKIEAKDLVPLAFGDSDSIVLGQTVIAIGNTLSEFRNTVTKGIISGINRTVAAGGNDGFSEVLEEVLQTDAPINPGNSGGPLLNLQGEVIGINTAVAQAGQSIGFAIPINEAKQVIESIKATGKIVRPYLGVRYLVLNKQIAKINNLEIDHGALIISNEAKELAVVPGSPADKAGLEVNDIILEVNGQLIDENHSLARILGKNKSGDEVTLKIWHKGEEKAVKVKLTERPSE